MLPVCPLGAPAGVSSMNGLYPQQAGSLLCLDRISNVRWASAGIWDLLHYLNAELVEEKPAQDESRILDAIKEQALRGK